MAERQKLRLGTLMVQRGIISDEQLEAALALQKSSAGIWASALSKWATRRRMIS